MKAIRRLSKTPVDLEHVPTVLEHVPAIRRLRDTLVFCTALACAFAAACIDDPAPAVIVATASR